MKHELIQNLVRVAATWLDRRYSLRHQALVSAAPEFCLSPASFELALDWIFHQWTETRIKAWVESNPFKNARYATQVLAGNTPAIIAQGFLQGAILNLPQCLKLPSQQPTFARLLHQSFAETSVALSQLFELNTGGADLPHFYSRLAKADLVLAYGQDETMAELKKHLAPDAVFIQHGQADSAAIIFKEAATLKTLENLAYDFLSYDQRGCLSPRVTFIEQGGELSPADCARVFAEIVLPPLAQQFPRGGLFPGEAAEILHQRSLSGFRGQVYCGVDWTVCYDEKSDWPEQVLPRFMPFKAFKTNAALVELLNPVKNHLISLGYAGPKSQLTFLKETFATRLCALGEMQKQVLVF